MNGAGMIGAALALLALTSAQAPPPGDVRLHALVVDAGGNSVRGLAAADFEVLINDAPAPVSAVVPRGALSLAVVIDRTRSANWGAGWMRPPTEPVAAVLAALQPADRVRLGTFGARVTFPHPWAPVAGAKLGDTVATAMASGGRGSHGPSPIWDVLHDTVEMLAQEPAPRAILLVTDGRSTGNARSIEETANLAALHGVAIHTIVRYVEVQLPATGDLALSVRPWAAFERLGLFTGGRSLAHSLNEGLAAAEAARQLGAAIRDGYALTVPHIISDGTPRRLLVRSKRPGLRVTAPLAYVPATSR